MIATHPQEDFRVLTPEVFDYVFHNELKRALRSQNFFTFVVVEPRLKGGDPEPPVTEVARLISREIRETDLVAATPVGQILLLLLDADLESALGVIERLLDRLERYRFESPLTVNVGAACCPTHGADAETLRRAVVLTPALPRERPDSEIL